MLVRPRRKLSELKRGERAALVAALTQYRLHITGHEVGQQCRQGRRAGLVALAVRP